MVAIRDDKAIVPLLQGGGPPKVWAMSASGSVGLGSNGMPAANAKASDPAALNSA